MPPTFSNRVPRALVPNALTVRLASLEAEGIRVADLTGSNPTMAGISYPANLLDPLADVAGIRYRPEPAGTREAREAVAAECARRNCQVSPDHIVLTASSSEAYTWLFKLFCRPGERVLVPRPSYPLFDHLARLEGVRLDTYDLDYRGRWDIDLEAIRRANDDVRAIVVVSPNNPTGSCVNTVEFDALSDVCRQRGWALIADEVFADYPLETEPLLTDLAARASCLTISLGGLSKSVGLPQIKVGWMMVGGPQAERDATLEALEFIADSFLSVSTPAQVALARLLDRGAAVRHAIQARLRTNLSIVRDVATGFVGCSVPRIDGGWSAVVRVPATRSEETLVMELVDRERILVHPGYFFDFRHEAFLVFSLLTEPELLRSALPRVLRLASE